MSADQSVIHDIGYQRYTGPRLGSLYAMRSLYLHGLRAAFGLGRTAKGKIFPWTMIALVTILAIIVGAVKAQTGEWIMTYQDFPSVCGLLVMLFAAIVGPELVSRDLGSNTLPLYFSRPLSRSGYALAKLGALITAVFLLTAAPLILIFASAAFSTPDGMTGVWHELRGMLGGWTMSALYAVIYSSLALLIASLTKRRAIAACMVAAVFLVSLPVVGVLIAVGGEGSKLAQLAPVGTPALLVEGLRAWLFGNDFDIGPFGPIYGLVAVGLTVVCGLLLLLRYRKVSL